MKSARTKDNVTRVHAAVEEDRRVTLRKLAEDLDISFGSAQRIVMEDLNMRRVSARWVPRLLKDHEMANRVTESKEFLRRWRRDGELVSEPDPDGMIGSTCLSCSLTLRVLYNVAYACLIMHMYYVANYWVMYVTATS